MAPVPLGLEIKQDHAMNRNRTLYEVVLEPSLWDLPFKTRGGDTRHFGLNKTYLTAISNKIVNEGIN